MIRRATPADLAAMVAMGYRLCDRTPYAHIERDRPSIVQTFSAAMASQFGCAFVAERTGVITGLLVGVSQELWFSRYRYATDLIFYSERAWDGYHMLENFVEWAWAVPRMVEITMARSSGINPGKGDALYRRAGLSRMGGVYTMTRRPRLKGRTQLNFPTGEASCRAS